MTVIDNYLKDVPEPQKAALERVRKIVKQTVPEAEEVITYGVPGFKYKGKYLIAFASYKDHLSIFPGSAPIETMRSELANYKLSKGTVQFTLDNPMPETTLKEIIKLCLLAIPERYSKKSK